MKKLLLGILFFGLFQSLYAQNCPPSTQSGMHMLQRGETLYRISKLYNVTVDQLMIWNNISSPSSISVCTPIYIQSPSITTTTTTPSYPSTVTTTSTAPSTTNYGGTSRYSKPFSQYSKQIKGVHTVLQDENIENLAKLYGYTVERFREFNGLSIGSEVTTGQVLRTTDCACLNTITDKPEELVEVTIDPYSRKVDRKTNPTGISTTTTSQTPTTTSSSPTTTAVSTTTSTATNIDTKAKATYMNNEELQMVDEINLIRSNPSGYIPYVEEYINYLQKNGSFGNSIETARELIQELKKTPALAVLEPKECVFTAARKHGEDEKKMGGSNHQGSDGSWPWDRILRECPGLQDGNENLVGGPADVRRAVMLLLVDDGIDNRGHRKTLLNPAWKYVACYKVGMIGNMPNSWVQNFAY